MSLKNKLFSVAGVALATAALSTFTVAQDASATNKADKAEKHERGEGRGFRKDGFDRKGAFGHRGGFGGAMGFKGLNLTDAQKQQIKSIMQANKPNGSHRDELKAFAEARRNGTLTDVQKAQIKQLRETAQNNRKAVHEKVLSVLTAEQRAQLEQRKTEMQKRREEFRQNRENRRRDFRKNGNPDKTKTIKTDTI